MFIEIITELFKSHAKVVLSYSATLFTTELVR